MSEFSGSRQVRLLLLTAPLSGALALAGCSNSVGGEPSSGAPAAGFSIMVAQANDADDFYAQTAAAYTEETGVGIEVIPYPSEAYYNQVTTQLQAGNSADVMILSPGTGSAVSIISLAQAGFLEPLDRESEETIPEGTMSLYEVDGQVYGQPAALTPQGIVWNAAGAAEVGIDEYPASYAEWLDACETARGQGKDFMVLAGAAPLNTGTFASLLSATRVYGETPDWNEQRIAGEVTFGDSGWRDVLEDILEMNDAGCFQPGAEGGTFDSITAGIGGGTALSATVPGSAAASIGAATGLNLTVQAVPPADGENPNTIASVSYAWALNAKSDDAVKASVKDFLEWLAEPKQSQEHAERSGGVAVVGAAADTLLPSYEPLGELLETGAYIGFPSSVWPNALVYEALGVGVQGLLTGQQSVDQVLAAMDKAWDQ